MSEMLNHTMLAGKTILLTGAGGGIGFEAAKAFVEMGARVLIAEINQEKGKKAAAILNGRYPNAARFFYTDLSDEAAINQLYNDVLSNYGCPDIIFNNAAMVVTGKIGQVSMANWELSYAVNLRAPILLTTLFLEEMKKRNSGSIVFVSSSGAAPFLSAYEIYKTAQVEFSNALSMELEGTNVYTYTIAPGLVKTETAEKSIEIVASSMGMSTEEFYRQNEEHILDVQDAGIGFAVSTLMAGDYHGQEISSIQAINDFNRNLSEPNPTNVKANTLLSHRELLNKIIDTFTTQYNGWQSRNVFERQWVLRDFKKYVGMSADAVQKEFCNLKTEIGNGEQPRSFSRTLFEKLLNYWQHQLKLLQGFEKDKDKLAEHSQIICEWISDIQMLLNIENQISI